MQGQTDASVFGMPEHIPGSCAGVEFGANGKGADGWVVVRVGIGAEECVCKADGWLVEVECIK